MFLHVIAVVVQQIILHFAPILLIVEHVGKTYCTCAKSSLAWMHEGALCLVLALLGRTWQHASPTFFPHTLCLIWGLSSVSVTQYRCPCSLMALTEQGLTHKDRLSHVAGDAPLACCLSLYLTAVSWMRPDKGLQRRCKCPFLSMTPDARVQEHYSCYSCSGHFIRRVGVELHLWPVVLRESGLISGFFLAGFS